MQQIQKQFYICPDCQKRTMSVKDESMICTSCQSEIPLDIYMMSLELLQKQILIQLLKQFIAPGHGKLVDYQDNIFLVGISKNGNYICQEYQLQEGQVAGMYVSFTQEGDQN